ncbi:hypothetical protein E4T66_10770 [Sinimarinibacterium sp. CAU 1509]|uniref:hypothetical protein n=1 Tax=Sinimarinibacterium sp. CAU 1509 TaxID=2562283 RepID=UPI0010AD17B6|nr:hypothetical protein [Sinimarinibacterium sp. CAU 1509]TJY61104.1 hypothetical protein E4T66_10770 [Sinimarinibacterium sp. CAU 1509]
MIGYDFRLHAGRSMLQGVEYVELQAGAFAQQYWKDDSRYVQASAFALIDRPLREASDYEDVHSTVTLAGEAVKRCCDAWRAAARRIEAGEVLTAVRALGVAHLPLIDGEIGLQAPQVIALLDGLADYFEQAAQTKSACTVVGL